MFDMMQPDPEGTDDDETRLDRGFTGRMARLAYMFCIAFAFLAPSLLLIRVAF